MTTESDSNSNSVDEMIITKEMEAEEALLEKQSCEIEKSDKKKIAEVCINYQLFIA